MNLLYANDRRGAYPGSWYAATARPLDPFPDLQSNTRADVCVVGGGFTGISTALHLAEAGADVALLEAQRVGFGASGRNGGQVGSGMRKDQIKLEALFGFDNAMRLWQVGEDAKKLVKSLIVRHRIDAAWRDGIAHADWSANGASETQAYAEHLQSAYGYEEVEPLDCAELRSLVGSDVFQGGLIDWGAGHLHPLRFALGLAQAAAAAGVRVFEGSEACDVRSGMVRTSNGCVEAEHVVLAMNGYHGDLHPLVAMRVAANQ